MIAEFVKQNEHRNLMREMWFWRDAVGHEIDLVWQDDDTLNLVEFKASSTILNDMFKGLSYFDKWTDRPIKSQTVCYAGNETQKRKDITVLSWKDFNKI